MGWWRVMLLVWNYGDGFGLEGEVGVNFVEVVVGLC